MLTYRLDLVAENHFSFAAADDSTLWFCDNTWLFLKTRFLSFMITPVLFLLDCSIPLASKNKKKPCAYMRVKHCTVITVSLKAVKPSVCERLITKWGKGEGCCWRSLMHGTLRPGCSGSRRCLFILFLSFFLHLNRCCLLHRKSRRSPVCMVGSERQLEGSGKPEPPAPPHTPPKPSRSLSLSVGLNPRLSAPSQDNIYYDLGPQKKFDSIWCHIPKSHWWGSSIHANKILLSQSTFSLWSGLLCDIDWFSVSLCTRSTAVWPALTRRDVVHFLPSPDFDMWQQSLEPLDVPHTLLTDSFSSPCLCLPLHTHGGNNN